MTWNWGTRRYGVVAGGGENDFDSGKRHEQGSAIVLQWLITHDSDRASKNRTLYFNWLACMLHGPRPEDWRLQL